MNLGIQALLLVRFNEDDGLKMVLLQEKLPPTRNTPVVFPPEASHCQSEEYNDRSRRFTTDHGETIQVRC